MSSSELSEVLSLKILKMFLVLKKISILYLRFLQGYVRLSFFAFEVQMQSTLMHIFKCTLKP